MLPAESFSLTSHSLLILLEQAEPDQIAADPSNPAPSSRTGGTRGPTHLLPVIANWKTEQFTRHLVMVSMIV